MEMSLMRASRIATTATIDELLRAVKAMKAAPAGEAAKTPAPQAEAPKKPEPMTRREILSDRKLDSIISSIPGASIINIKEPRK
jgi:hypothetical protein